MFTLAYVKFCSLPGPDLMSKVSLKTSCWVYVDQRLSIAIIRLLHLIDIHVVRAAWSPKISMRARLVDQFTGFDTVLAGRCPASCNKPASPCSMPNVESSCTSLHPSATKAEFLHRQSSVGSCLRSLCSTSVCSHSKCFSGHQTSYAYLLSW